MSFLLQTITLLFMSLFSTIYATATLEAGDELFSASMLKKFKRKRDLNFNFVNLFPLLLQALLHVAKECLAHARILAKM
jgi:hypothetical protein